MYERDDQTNVLLNVLAGIGIGAILGAVAGMLLAPKAGRESGGKEGEFFHDGGRFGSGHFTPARWIRLSRMDLN